jgi:hypothetical protein
MQFLVPSGILDLAKINLSDSHSNNASQFFIDANMPPGRNQIGDIMQIIPSPGECFDYGFMVYSALNNKPFAVFIDTKSGREHDNKVNNTKRNIIPFVFMSILYKLYNIFFINV